MSKTFITKMEVFYMVVWQLWSVELLSSCLILLVGSLIAWYTIHRNRRINMERQSMKDLIRECEDLLEKLSIVLVKWHKWINSPNNFELYYDVKVQIIQLETKRKMIVIRFLDQDIKINYMYFKLPRVGVFEEKKFTFNEVNRELKSIVNELSKSLNEIDKITEDSKRDIGNRVFILELQFALVLTKIISEQVSKRIPFFLRRLYVKKFKKKQNEMGENKNIE